MQKRQQCMRNRRRGQSFISPLPFLDHWHHVAERSLDVGFPIGSAHAILPRMAERRLKRPRDPAQLAKLIVDIATGEIEDREPTPEERGKDPAASAMGRKGGPARA
jgi:hypothetical protein